MNLSTQQMQQTSRIWKDYVENGERFVNASQEYSHQELDQNRREVIPQILDWLNRFLRDDVSLEEFKTANDSINKRNRLWGFRAINGQMFFNMVTNSSLTGNRRDELINLLKVSLPVPSSIAQASNVIKSFEKFVRELAQYSANPRSAPKPGSIPFFLSYFWQIQQPEKFPIYYSSMVNALIDLDIWSPSGEVDEDYCAFYELNHVMLEFLSGQSVRKLHLWDVEHAFWFYKQPKAVLTTAQPTQPGLPTVGPAINRPSTRTSIEDISESYIPPVVSILPKLAANDPTLAELYQKNGRAIEKVFEEKLAILFRMLGFETQLLGQGQGRVPDGVAVCQEYRYAIIYDAKVRQNAYTMGTDERAIREYITRQDVPLRRQGMRNVYFMVISSVFSGDHDDAIRTLKIDTNVNEVLLVEVNALLAMLEGKLQNPAITLGSDGIQRLLASSGLLTESDVREFLDI